MNTRPGWLTAVCIIAIAFGGLGLMMSLFNVASLLLQDRIQTAIVGMQPQVPNSQIADVQQEMQQAIMEVTNKWAPVTIGLGVVNFLVSGVLLFGGIQALRLRPSGRTLLIAAFVAAMVVDGAVVIPTYLIQRDTSLIMGDYMPKIMQQTAPQGKGMPPGMDGFMQASMKAGMYIGIVMAFGMAAVKVGAYLTGIVVLRKPAICALYAGDSDLPAGTGGDAEDPSGADEWNV